ncbi:MAG: T9SS type A sorting domain-containing protein [Bacteroidales bacterium]|nr:T9SS type A sorting domain-containing protein [Bacteroidales bacterium]
MTFILNYSRNQNRKYLTSSRMTQDPLLSSRMNFELEGLVLEHLNLLTLAQGTYLFTVKSGDQSATKKIIVI